MVTKKKKNVLLLVAVNNIELQKDKNKSKENVIIYKNDIL